MFSIRSIPYKQRPALLLLFVTTLLLTISACGSTSGDNTPKAVATVAAPSNLVTPGKLTVGLEPSYTPMEFLDPNTNDYNGFDVDLARSLAQHMNLQLEIKRTSFDTIFDDLNNKRFDVVISGVTVNAEREAKFDFVPYFNAGESLLVHKGNPKHLKSVADLCGLQVGVQIGTVEQADLEAASAACKQQGKAEIKQSVLSSQTEVIQLLVENRVDATYQDSPVTDYYNTINPGQFEIGGPVVHAQPYGIVVRKGDSSMLDAVKNSFKALQSDGSYEGLFKKWNFTDSQKVALSPEQPRHA
ncbi:ABC transporter substrate-binding protein [Tengunoibacter tsumagoiensis]|uniref:ABC transporter substrate-binding protein n=1 Tax=Tengunoibacter tsumagoiensis TaxID=2014871 RepID=A0A402A0K1_9CHLR|nr:ABC transporter substrate-binding protein [Tengunoibacter tsumagoiensis]GCE12589.1 ABC transporter substrate-binding protein [Tengunoibacter tsumagoiensis]